MARVVFQIANNRGENKAEFKQNIWPYMIFEIYFNLHNLIQIAIVLHTDIQLDNIPGKPNKI